MLFVCSDAGLGLGDVVPLASRFMDDGEHVMILVGRLISYYSRVGIRAGRFYVSSSHLRDVASEELRNWWITCVGLQTGRSVKQDYERESS